MFYKNQAAKAKFWAWLVIEIESVLVGTVGVQHHQSTLRQVCIVSWTKNLVPSNHNQ
jgi:hypothetical protein